jgi:hypothetical protein
MQDSYTENYKILLTDIQSIEINREQIKGYFFPWVGRLTIITTLIYRFNAVPIKFPTGFIFVEID